MRPKMYSVHLTDPERDQLTQWSKSYRHSKRERLHASILLLADEAEQSDGTQFARKDAEVATLVKVKPLTVSRVRKRFCERGLQFSVLRKVQEKRKPRLLDGEGEAHLIALTCSTPPEGHQRWGLKLLKNTLIEQQIVDTISQETVSRYLRVSVFVSGSKAKNGFKSRSRFGTKRATRTASRQIGGSQPPMQGSN